ncbi:hypothetical protein MTO96_034647 [Rhipicephalus appendiculatus]
MENAHETQERLPLDEASPGPSPVLSEQLKHQESQWQMVVCLHRKRRLRKQLTSGEQELEQGGRLCTSKTTLSELALTQTPATGEQGQHARDVPENADARSRPRQRAPPLPRADLKVIIRPSPRLIVRELRSHQVAKAIIHATGRASACKREDFIFPPETRVEHHHREHPSRSYGGHTCENYAPHLPGTATPCEGIAVHTQVPV